jgi:hypothetical protein
MYYVWSFTLFLFEVFEDIRRMAVEAWSVEK